MKKLVCLLFVLFLLVPVAQAEEITFRGIPWGSSIDEVEKALSIKGTSFSNKEGHMLSWDACRPNGYDYFEYAAGHTFHLIPANDAFNVAGYPVESITAYCSYGLNGGVQRDSKDSNFYLASYTFDVIDVRSAYNDLQEKLNTLYGEGQPDTGNSDVVMLWAIYEQEATVWYGDNETGVLLSLITTNEDSDFKMDSLTLYYGKTDSKEMLNAVCGAIHQELIDQEHQSKTNSTDGL